MNWGVVPSYNTFSKKQPIFAKLAKPTICRICTRFPRYLNFQIWYNKGLPYNKVKIAAMAR